MNMEREIWTEKYRPRNFSEVYGQEKAILGVRDFFRNFNPKKGRKTLLLHGPPGVGKTTLVQLIAKETFSEIFELNASDLRNKKKLKEVLQPAIKQQSLLGKNKIFLIDEVDGLSISDFGGVSEISALIKITRFPILLTANDGWKKSLVPLRRLSTLLEVKELSYSLIKDFLRSILKKEGKNLSEDVLTSLSINSNGDLRAAINDLQTLSELNSGEIKGGDFYTRNKKGDVFNVMKRLFQDRPTKEIFALFDSLNLPLDQILLWIEKNIPKDYRGKEIKRAFEALSRATIFERRIYKKNYWRYLIYKIGLMSFGVSVSKNGIKGGFTRYEKPTRILKIWLNNQRTLEKKSVAEKYARKVHIGKKRALAEFPSIKIIINSDLRISKELGLDQKELDYLRSSY